MAAWMLPVIGWGINAGVNWYNQRKQKQANVQNRQFSREMYDKQRKDALSDWERNNQYNSPAAQMKRLKQAGLNPNLAYGTANPTSAPIRSSSAQSANAIAPRLDPNQGMNLALGYANVMKTQQETDNLKSMKRNIDTDTMLKSAQEAHEMAKKAKTEQERKRLEATAHDYMRIVHLQANNLAADQTRNAIDIDRAKEIRISKMQVKKMIQEIESLDNDNSLKQLHIQMRNMGIEPGSAQWLKFMNAIAQKNPTVAKYLNQ